MKSPIVLLLLTFATACLVASCANRDEDQKPQGPASETSKIPWNAPVAGQGQGQFGMIPQNQYRR